VTRTSQTLAGKETVGDIAAFGGKPLFATVRPIGQLSLPDERQFFALARGIFDRRRITNNGPVVQELERRLAAMHRVPYCIAYANATIALIALLKIVAGPVQGEVILPAFTYPGLPHIVRWAGHVPRFCDIERESHALSPIRVAEAIGPSTRAILGVHQVNSPCAIDELTALARERAVPLVFDAVHGVGCVHRGQPIGGFGMAEVFSLHATKLINTSDERLADSLRKMRNFGIVGESEIGGLGLNGKLNEIHAAAALACLNGVKDVIGRNAERHQAYCAALAGLDGLRVLPYPAPAENWNYEFVLLEVSPPWPLSRDATVALLRGENALVRPYYSPPLHLEATDPAQPPPSLPVTEDLSRRFIQMAVGELVSTEDIQEIAVFMRFLQSHARPIEARLAAAERGTR